MNTLLQTLRTHKHIHGSITISKWIYFCTYFYDTICQPSDNNSYLYTIIIIILNDGIYRSFTHRLIYNITQAFQFAYVLVVVWNEFQVNMSITTPEVNTVKLPMYMHTFVSTLFVRHCFRISHSARDSYQNHYCCNSMTCIWHLMHAWMGQYSYSIPAFMHRTTYRYESVYSPYFRFCLDTQRTRVTNGTGGTKGTKQHL